MLALLSSLLYGTGVKYQGTPEVTAPGGIVAAQSTTRHTPCSASGPREDGFGYTYSELAARRVLVCSLEK